MVQLQQAEDLWKAIRNDDVAETRRMRMVELAALLLKHARMDDQTLKSIAGTDDLTDFLLAYLNAAEHVGTFLIRALPEVEPELKASEFERQVGEIATELTAVVERTEGLRQSHAELLMQSELLTAQSQELKILEDHLDQLQRLREMTKPERLIALREEIETLRAEVEPRRDEMKKLVQERDRLQEISRTGQELLQTLQLEREDTIGQLVELSSKLASSLDLGWDECDRRLSRELRKLQQRNAEYRKVTTELDKCLKELETVTEAEKVNRELYDMHFAADAQLQAKWRHDAGTFGATARERVLRLSDMSSKIAGALQEFDLALREAIVVVEETLRDIRRLNMTA
ncbi:hypothetical protein [Desulforhabdus sp. TSK]|uniref:hypothetical protein n=1 Tax=Desulforhabdus sp. TSK TaxID=2925014 RepID=UPI001FC7F34B|nr:hypothetical protein [Desulforhabdus sp. TSK]GKT09145.1 hypothetical protein DSTSK_24500 [Desulforhabdus sp. TSK]